MLSNIKITNYKSIDKLDFKLGRVNVLIGENGAGKSNLLEAIALSGAAISEKLDSEFLTSRGIRVTSPEYMRSAFTGLNANDPILIEATSDDGAVSFRLTNDNEPYSKWTCETTGGRSESLDLSSFTNIFQSFVETSKEKDSSSKKEAIDVLTSLREQLSEMLSDINDDTHTKKKSSRKLPKKIHLEFGSDSSLGRHFASNYVKNHDPSASLQHFIIYSPENSALRTFQREGQIEPLGINGEGLLRLLSVLQENSKYKGVYSSIRRSLRVLGWFDDFQVIDDKNKPVSRMEIKDKYLAGAQRHFDQMSTNEGFLYLVFYFSLFSCDLTPRFFAVDNIDASLNPKLCSFLMKRLAELANTHDKQVILTTHNPAILDGLNLNDDNQRLFVVHRNRLGNTRLTRIEAKGESAAPLRLSEAFLRGSLGGLPKGF